MIKSIAATAALAAALAAALMVAALMVAAPAQAYHGRPMHPVTSTSHPRHVHSGADATLDEWRTVELGWTKGRVQDLFDSDGTLIGNWREGVTHLHMKQYAVDDSHVARIIYVDAGIHWLVDTKEWCTKLVTGDLSCLT